MLATRTGGFPIGFRRGWSEWQKDISGPIQWAKANGFSVIDVGADVTTAKTVAEAGLHLGSVDLADWSGVISANKDKRDQALAKNEELFAALAPLGTMNYFAVLLPETPEKKRSENFEIAVEGLTALAQLLEKYSGRLVLEGWPGNGALACTPESYRAVFNAVPSKSMGVNFDPSHLVRMGIDPIRFVEEFASRVYHVHGKDTEIITEGVYEFGTEISATLAHGHGFGSHHWRYTIPGHGQVRWVRAFEILKAAGYAGAVSIELEDENFNTDEAGEKQGLLAGGTFLSSC
jgi:sugar phosphate isomerase/epimerase